MNVQRIFWTETEEKMLKENASNETLEGLTKLFKNRTRDAIKLKCYKLKLSFKKHISEKSSNLSVLLEETNEAYYWIGFLLADGHFSNNRIMLKLAKKDSSHVLKFRDFIESSNKVLFGKENCAISVAEIDVVRKLKNKFEIVNRKTYTPCNVYLIKEDDLFVSLLIGFIDGDGNITRPKPKIQDERKFPNIRIKLHSSWYNVLKYFNERMIKICNIKNNKTNIIINNRGYAVLCFSNNLIVKFLKIKAKEFGLPIMSRKWDKIDETLIGRHQASENNLKNILELLKIGEKQTNIAKKLKLSDSCVSHQIKKFKKNGGSL